MQTAKERDPQGLPTRLAIAQWALETNRLDEAKENAKAALQLDPDNFQVRLLDGVLARIEKDYGRAEDAFRSSHLLAPTNGVVLNQLAIALASQDDQAKKELAFQYAQMASKLFGDPKTVLGRETLVVLGWVLFRLDQLPQADAVIRQALSQGGIGEDSAYFAAQVFQEAGRSEPALQLLNRALDDNERLFPNRQAAMDLRAKILSSTNATGNAGTGSSTP
jgi:tetratricopeptide (TPR) repeat protein